MNTVFEEFVRVALGEALHEPASRFGKRVLWFDQDETTTLQPDLTWAPHAAPRFVGDAKYRRIDDKMCHPDLCQMLAYIVATDVPNGLLIYPKGGEVQETSLRVANMERTIEIRTLDISAEPKDILASVARIAEWVRATAKHSLART